jgi:hypothetical protein
LADGDYVIVWTAKDPTPTADNFVLYTRRQGVEGGAVIADSPLQPMTSLSGEGVFTALGGPGYYLEVLCKSCKWTVTVTRRD